jgi:hypothetical protein
MWMQDERSGEPTEEQPSISHTFRHVYRFILRAMQGDTAVVSALFQQYVAGELPEKLLALSRRCVQEDQAALRARRSSGAACKKIKKGRAIREINGAPPEGRRQICRARDRLAGSPRFPFLLFVGAWRHRHHFSALRPRLGFALTCAPSVWVEPRRHGRGLCVGVPDGKRSFLCEEGMWLQQVMLKLAKMGAKISDELRV